MRQSKVAPIFQALFTLPDAGIAAYAQLLSGSQGLLYATLGCTLAALITAFTYADRMVWFIIKVV
ncbi:hypothetical protein BC828DRAFT_386452 [Blastocladiella britannica]|nr:hypothetical protein BC828DRAFT_386452 [Blastocladiella britannica]